MKKLLILIFAFYTQTITATTTPKLIVQIVIDQLRGDLIQKHHRQFGSEGFNYLLAHGLNYQNAHHPHANTVTCVGHATIATGASPALHGIINNDWYDRTTGRSIYCVEDLQANILPTLRTRKKLDGRSPRNIAASTTSDELVLAKAGRAFAVSLKDRAAVTLAGHAGKAFWFDKDNGGLITSSHYYSAYPDWVKAWNKQYESKELIWSLSMPENTYINAHSPRFKNRFAQFSYNFPHSTGLPGSPDYYKLFAITPFADEVIADFAIHLLAQEKLGTIADKTDYLAVSFSAVDGIGHQFGPNSLEAEDNLIRLDKTLAKLLIAIDKQVGLKNSLIVLTADHGVSDSLTYLADSKMDINPAINLPTLQSKIETLLNNRFQLPAQALQAIDLPYIYLNHSLISDKQLSLQEITSFLADKLDSASIFRVYALPLKNSFPDWLSNKVSKMYFPERSGDLYIVSPPYQKIDANNEEKVMHGTPWQYDSYIPLIFANPEFKAQLIAKPVKTTDIAPTLSAIMAIKTPSAAIGRPLNEVLGQYVK